MTERLTVAERLQLQLGLKLLNSFCVAELYSTLDEDRLSCAAS